MAKSQRNAITALASGPPGEPKFLNLNYVHAYNIFVTEPVFTVSFCMDPPSGNDKGRPPKQQTVTVKVAPSLYFLDPPSKNVSVTAGYYEAEFRIDKDRLTGQIYEVAVSADAKGAQHKLETTAFILRP
jgi:hypothetical protein